MSDEPKGLLKRATSAVKADLQRGKATPEEDAERQRQVEAQAAQQAAAEAAAKQRRSEWITAGKMFEYKVEQIRTSLLGDKVKTDELEQLLNRYAQDGWQLKSVTAAEVGGRIGPGGTSGLVVVFERQITA